MTRKQLFRHFCTALLAAAFITVFLAAGASAGALESAVAELKDASTVNDQLRILYDVSKQYATDLETGGWQYSLTCDPADGLPEDLKYTTEQLNAMEGEEFAMADFADSKMICLYNDSGRIRLLGDFQVRIPERNRASSVEEADAVMYLAHYSTNRSDYIGSAWNRHYDVCVFRRNGSGRYWIYTKTATPPVAGYGILSGETVALSDIWNGARPWFYGTVELRYPEGTVTYRITGNTCSLASLEGEFVRYEVPEAVEGYPVTGIERCQNNTLEELVLPEGLVFIQRISCKKLRSMNFPSTLRRITEYINTNAMENVMLNEGLEEIGDFALLSAHGESFTLPSTLKSVGRGMLEHGTDCPYIIVPDGMTALPDYFMMDSRSLLSIYIPATVTKFGSDLINEGRCRIFAPAGSRAAQWAEHKGYHWTACERPDDMPRAYYGTENGFVYGIVGGEAILTGYTGSEEDVRIPATLGGRPVTTIQFHAFYSNNVIRSIVFPDTVTLIREYFADDCKGLTAAYIPASAADVRISSYWMKYVANPEFRIYLQEGSEYAKQWESSDFRWAVWEPGMDERPEESCAWNDEQKAALRTPGASVTFGRWELNGNEADGPEDIEWLVLSAEENRSLLVAMKGIGKELLDTAENHPTYMPWSACSLRKWLQTACIDSMFTRSERSRIVAVQHGDISEKIFLLSTEEADALFAADEDRICLFSENGEDVSSSWWLRSMGTKDSDYAAYVNNKGNVIYAGMYFHNRQIVRPAIWVEND